MRKLAFSSQFQIGIVDSRVRNLCRSTALRITGVTDTGWIYLFGMHRNCSGGRSRWGSTASLSVWNGCGPARVRRDGALGAFYDPAFAAGARAALRNSRRSSWQDPTQTERSGIGWIFI